MTITYGAHARDILAERGVEPAWVERAVLAPDSTEPDPSTRIARTLIGRCLSAMGECCAWYMSRHPRVPTW